MAPPHLHPTYLSYNNSYIASEKQTRSKSKSSHPFRPYLGASGKRYVQRVYGHPALGCHSTNRRQAAWRTYLRSNTGPRRALSFNVHQTCATPMLYPLRRSSSLRRHEVDTKMQIDVAEPRRGLGFPTKTTYCPHDFFMALPNPCRTRTSFFVISMSPTLPSTSNSHRPKLQGSEKVVGVPRTRPFRHHDQTSACVKNQQQRGKRHPAGRATRRKKRQGQGDPKRSLTLGRRNACA